MKPIRETRKKVYLLEKLENSKPTRLLLLLWNVFFKEKSIVYTGLWWWWLCWYCCRFSYYFLLIVVFLFIRWVEGQALEHKVNLKYFHSRTYEQCERKTSHEEEEKIQRIGNVSRLLFNGNQFVNQFPGDSIGTKQFRMTS